MNETAKSAGLLYLTRGWSVFLLLPNSKKPAGEWAKWYRQRPVPADLADWSPSANIAIVTGAISGIAVVDFDPKKGGTEEVFKRFVADYPTGVIAQTGGGGWHAYYKIPDSMEVKCRVNVMPGVDIRGEGGYVVGPPSMHESGRRYKFLEEGQLGAFPIKYAGVETTRTTNVPGWVEKAFTGVSEGGRDQTCAQLAGYLYYRGVSRPVAVSILQAWNQQNHPPLPIEGPDGIEKTVLSVYRRADSAPVTESVFSTDPDAKSAFEFIKFADYMAKFSESENRWLVDGWMPANTIAFAISPPGTYKTWVMLDLCVSVASGKKFLDRYEVRENGPVMILQQEDHNGSLVERLSVITHQRFLLRPTWSDDGDLVEFDSPPDLPIYHHTERKLRFDDKNMMRAFVQQVEKIRPKLVVLDPLYSATSTEDFMAKAAQDMFIFKDLRDRFGTSFLICHHTNKSGDDRSRMRAWGSQFLNAFLETGWQFSQRPGGKSIGVRRHFKSAAEPKDVVLKFDISLDPDDYRYIPTVVDKEEQDLEDEEFDSNPVVEKPTKKKKEKEPTEVRTYADSVQPPPRSPKSPKLSLQAKAEEDSRALIMRTVVTKGGQGCTTTEIVAVTGLGRATVFRTVKDMIADGELTKAQIGQEMYYAAAK